MGEIERLLPGTKVSDWAATAIAAALPTTHIDYAGYSAGGTGPVNTTDKFSFPSDSRSTPSALNLSSGRAYTSGCSNNSIFAYVAGGSDSFPTNVDIVDKFTFPEHVRTTLSAGLSSALGDLGGTSNNGTAAYFFRQDQDVDKFAYSNDSRSTLGTGRVQSGGSYSREGAANGTTAGYFGGGTGGGGPTGYSRRIEKILYSNEVITNLSAYVFEYIAYMYGYSNSGTAAYFAGGSYYSSGWLVSNKYSKMVYSNETTSTLTATLSSLRYEGQGMADSGVAGYSMGGSNATTVDKLTFSNDTSSALSTGLSASMNRGAGYAHCSALAQ